MKRLVFPFLAATFLSAAALFAGTNAAFAHAFLARSSPAVGSIVHGSPPLLEIWFTEEVEPAFCAIEVRDKSGRRVDHGGVEGAADDKAALILSLPPLAPGAYKVIWHAVSVDTHKTSGDFAFTVAP